MRQGQKVYSRLMLMISLRAPTSPKNPTESLFMRVRSSTCGRFIRYRVGSRSPKRDTSS